MGDRHSSSAKNAMGKTHLRQIICARDLITRPEILKSVIATCKQERYYVGMHMLADLGHLDRTTAHALMAEWAFEDGNIAECRAKLGTKCCHVKKTAKTISLYLACQHHIKNPQEERKKLLALGKERLRLLALTEDIIKPVKKGAHTLIQERLFKLKRPSYSEAKPHQALHQSDKSR